MNVVLEPLDVWNRKLLDQVFPADWVNPTPSGKYNLVVVGGGTAGLVTAAGAAGLGAKVALVERQWLGGDCLNVGCVPSKALLSAAAESWHRKERGPEVFERAMEKVRRIRSQISPQDSASRFAQLGVDVFLGPAEFVDRQTLKVGDSRLTFVNSVIATGARAVVPSISGMDRVGARTNESIFNLSVLPRRLAVIGGGPIGCELSQAFQRLGSEVTLISLAPRVLDREDLEASKVLGEVLASEGVRLQLGTELLRFEIRGVSKVVHWKRNEVLASGEFDEILMGMGRAPNVEGMGLEKAGVEFDARTGVKVDDFLRTTNPKIYAAGDVCMAWKFTHAADFAARIVIQNALFLGRKRLSALNMPWCTYTDPEVAHTGLYRAEAERRGIDVEEWARPYEKVDRAQTEESTEGFVRILTNKRSGRIVGATIVGPHAGDMISEISLAMTAKMSLGQLADVIHPYPTRAEAIRQLGDDFNRRRLTPRVKGLFTKYLDWRRS